MIDIKKTGSWLLLIMIGILPSYGQDCNALYKEALQKYQNGDVQRAYELVQECMEARQLLAKTEKTTKGNLFWLGTQSSILLKKNKEAKSFLKRMLAIRPFYKPDKDDLQDVSTLMDELVIKPRLSVRLMGGFTGTNVDVERRFEIFVNENGRFSSPKSYNREPEINVMAGAELQFTVNKYVSVGLGVAFSEEQYRYNYQLQQGIVEYDIDQLSDGSFDTLQTQTYSLFQRYDHLQDLTYVKFPLSIRIHPKTFGRIEPYIEGGGYWGALLGANKVVTIEEVDSYTVTSDVSSVEQTEILQDFFTTNVKAMMITGTIGWHIGAGVNLKIHRTNFFAGFRYQFGLNTIIEKTERYNFEDLTYDFYDIMDDVRVRSGQVFFGWSIPIAYKAYDHKIPIKKRKRRK
ncbi:MAG: porin family protein [Flammeovirgaceae bacterium]